MPKTTRSMVIRVTESDGKKIIALWKKINAEFKKQGIKTKISQPEAYEAFKIKETGQVAIIRHKGKKVVV